MALDVAKATHSLHLPSVLFLFFLLLFQVSAGALPLEIISESVLDAETVRLVGSAPQHADRKHYQNSSGPPHLLSAHVQNKFAFGRDAELVMRVMHAANFKCNWIVDEVDVLDGLAAVFKLLLILDTACAFEAPALLVH